jgi:hypothetical protein
LLFAQIARNKNIRQEATLRGTKLYAKTSQKRHLRGRK